jgi:uroporphyrinogen-III decarboxylase
MNINKINNLLDKLIYLYETDENKRRQMLWENIEPQIRGESQWHGIPKGFATQDDIMPVTAECLNVVWMEILDFNLDRYYKEPEYYLEYYLKMKIKKFQEFPDDTPIDLNIPIYFGVIFEAALLGQKIYFNKKEEPALANESIISETTELRDIFDFENNDFLNHVKDFYNKIKEIVGPSFNIIFPYWYRGPQGVALYIRGFEEFLTDIFLNPELAHKIMRYVTDAQKSYTQWRANFLDEPIKKIDLFNDDIPLMGPKEYRDFIFPYEEELCDFSNGIYYWHSCGDITKHIPEIIKLKSIELLDFGVSMEDKKKGLDNLSREMPIECRVLAPKYIQNASIEDMKVYMKKIIKELRRKKIKKYVLRSSGMSILLGAQKDIGKLRRWIEVTKELQINRDLF